MSVHSIDGSTWLTKLERIGELSAKNPSIIFNNLGHVVNADMLKELYHQLDGKKAVGIDNVTKAMYGENFDENVSKLIKCIRHGTYKPKPSRLTEIPKEDGSKRPLAISCFEDKLVQLAISTILGKIYEPLFLPCSYGFRPGRSCHDALRALNHATFKNENGAVVEIDISKYFNTIPHMELMKILRNKIVDLRFLRLIEALIKTPILEGKDKIANLKGCPQGSIISPILANIYLHTVIDEWFEEIRCSHLQGRAEIIRYADDIVFTFEKRHDAERFYKALPLRLKKYGLEMHVDKSQLITAGRLAAKEAEKERRRLPTFKFLGFTCYWGKGRTGQWRLKYTSRHDRFAEKLKGMKIFLKKNLNTKNTHELLKQVIRIIRGWMNYHAVSDNQRRVSQFLWVSRRIIFRWFNRRGGKIPLTWIRYEEILKALDFPNQWKTISMF
jgi:RNA-directed DNA polymerase